jgi:hypothetical protein
MATMCIRREWQKLKDEARDDDERWAFENPPNTRKKLGHHTGYVLVRNGKVVKHTVVAST